MTNLSKRKADCISNHLATLFPSPTLSSFLKRCHDTPWFHWLLPSLNLGRTNCLSVHNHSQLSLPTTTSPPI
ncbi:hypothetical protein BDM02DRAFT_3122508 [Thelephora ganbajun]|uniref:Uncharacterized protein n=1 Tax=Thelephora ganbajun TaxID=370292 RepID=A0ACB6Z3V3_THEGA|nr:hypothetical protein BDM02DRAFT_3122508 [Thelephora ganbajun]